MGSSIRLTGTAASPGYAEGPVFRLTSHAAAYRPRATPDEEIEGLTEAIGTASAHLADLIDGTSGEAADMLEFQLAMLSDDSLASPAFVAIRAGAAADRAWSDALDAEIAGYESSDDAYFRARSADLKDIRQQVLDALTAAHGPAAPSGAILFGEDIAPTRFLATDWSKGGGIALTMGSSASHVAMLARARGVPMVVGLTSAVTAPAGVALLDAEHGGVVLEPAADEMEAFRRAAEAYRARRRVAEDAVARPASSANGIRVRTMVNIAHPSDVERIDIATCDGVGLMRTEFLFGTTLPDEETQYRAYRAVLDWAAGRPVTIRTADAGGDKPVPGLTVEEGNPFLGLRGIRLSLARPDIFRLQIRALLRAATHGDLKVMFPMIAVPEEYTQACALFAEEAAALDAAGVAHRMPPLGIMVEVPSVAIAPELFADAAFLSIGSNDLTQYVMAAARDNTAVAALNRVTNPAVLRLIEAVATFGRDNRIPVSLCGDAGGDPAAIPALLQAGLRDLSVAPAQLALAKAAISGVTV
ncbi:MAG: phosphoenolpyruvate--protein phosphotransferase [Rhizobiaceae bacterium]|nr:phosphoenolpyruvate--protein phosphotransferase [Rhizobiaceae bacterium]